MATYKVYKKGNYLVIVNNTTNEYIEDFAREILITKNLVGSTHYTFNLRTEAVLEKVPFASIQDEAGAPYASAAAWETWYSDNTGFNAATSESVTAVADDLSAHESTNEAHGTDTATLTGIVMSIGSNSGVFSVSPGTGEVVDNSTVPATKTPVVFAGVTDITPLYIRTLVVVNSSGTLVQIDGGLIDLSPDQHRTSLEVGILAVFGGVITLVTNTPSINYGVNQRLSDLLSSIGTINRSGNVIAPNGSNLFFNKSPGETSTDRGNVSTDRSIPDITTNAAIIPVPSGINLLAYQDGSGGFTYEPFSGSITPNSWDDGTGVKATVGNNKWTNHQIYFFSATDTFVVYLGQILYSSIDNAVSGVNDSVIVDSVTALASLRGTISVKKGETALDSIDTVFTQGPKFKGGASTGAGVGTTNLQGAYNNSVDPELIIASGAAVSMQAATDGAQIVQDWKDELGVVKASMTGDGVFTVDKINILNLQSFNDETAAAALATGTVYQTTGAGASPLNVAGILMIKQ